VGHMGQAGKLLVIDEGRNVHGGHRVRTVPLRRFPLPQQGCVAGLSGGKKRVGPGQDGAGKENAGSAQRLAGLGERWKRLAAVGSKFRDRVNQQSARNQPLVLGAPGGDRASPIARRHRVCRTGAPGRGVWRETKSDRAHPSPAVQKEQACCSTRIYGHENRAGRILGRGVEWCRARGRGRRTGLRGNLRKFPDLEADGRTSCTDRRNERPRATLLLAALGAVGREGTGRG